MRFTPMTEEEISKNQRQFVIGQCRFDITGSQDAISKTSGKPMKVLSLVLTDCNGMAIERKFYISSATPWRIKEVLDAIGKGSIYDTGELKDEHVIDSWGTCVVKHQTYEKNGEKKQGIEVERFLVKTSSKSDSGIDPDLNDDVPF